MTAINLRHNLVKFFDVICILSQVDFHAYLQASLGVQANFDTVFFQ